MEDHSLLPPGFRFHPTDEELVNYYLTNKISNLSFTCKAISVVDLNKCEPWDLPHKASLKGEKEWYFYCLKDRKYPTGLRTNRATEAGYWKTTGRDKEIVGAGRRDIIGMKKTLVFYKGRAPSGVKSNWVIHEYRLDDSYNNSFKSTREGWVVCRVFQKTAKTMKPNYSPTSSLDSPSENLHSSSNPGPEFADFELTNNFNPYTNPNPRSSSSTPHYVFPNTNSIYEDNSSSAFVQGGNREKSLISTEAMNTMCNWLNPEALSAISGNNRPSSLWPVSASNIAMSSLILKAVQLKNAYNRQQQLLSMGEAAVSSSKQVMDHSHQGFDDWGSYLMNELDN